MKKTLFTYISVILVLIIISTSAYAYDVVGLSNFEKTSSYSNGLFKDVSATAWYKENVAAAYEYGLMGGNGDGTFSPLGNISIAETITVSTRLYGIYHFEYAPLFEDFEGLWYEPYVAYAHEYSIIDESFSNYTISATRAQFAQILANSIDPIDLEATNIVDDGAIPDVPMSSDYADAVYLLYRAGILAGSDSKGTFNPDSTITRAEAAAIITRIVDPSLRKSIELVGEY